MQKKAEGFRCQRPSGPEPELEPQDARDKRSWGSHRQAVLVVQGAA